jgi:5-methylcytosine-specific restriction endonuclease McrA
MRRTLDFGLRLGVFRRENYRCQHCGVEALFIELEVDHIRPVSRGGSDDPSNLQTLCVKCNRKKGNRFVG